MEKKMKGRIRVGANFVSCCRWQKNVIKDGGLVLLKWRERRFALRFAFRVKPRDRFVFQNVKIAPTTKGGDGLGVRGHPADCEPRPLYKGQNCIDIKCLFCLVSSCLAST